MKKVMIFCTRLGRIGTSADMRVRRVEILEILAAVSSEVTEIS